MRNDKKEDYAAFQTKLMLRFCGIAFLSVFIVIGIYLFLWKRRGGDWLVRAFKYFLHVGSEDAFLIYHNYFRSYKEFFFVMAIICIFMLLLWRLFRWMRQYFNEINEGIEALLADDAGQIYLSPEMLPFERKLNAVKQTLEKQKEETALAEQRKRDLVMYLAHDIRTPLTSMIGYLNLLQENLEAPAAQRERYVQITLDKAYRLEKMINEFFEITQYNSQQITLCKEEIDLYFMLIQLTDELSPQFSRRGNWVTLHIEESLSVLADGEKLARVFSNLLKNAAAYSYPQTEILVFAEKTEQQITVFIQNKGKEIPEEKLSALFDKFYRLDKARVSDTGGTGLGLAIASEIVSLHGGTIAAYSQNETITFTVTLPLEL